MSTRVTCFQRTPFHPDVDAGGGVCVLPRLQDCLRQLLKHEPLRELIDRKVLDGWRSQASKITAAADLLEGLAAADLAAALWTLRTAGYKHAVSLEPSDKTAQVRLQLQGGWCQAVLCAGSYRVRTWFLSHQEQKCT